MPRLLPQAPPPADADGRLVLKKVVPARVTAPPMTFSPLESVINHPDEEFSEASASAGVTPVPQAAATWMQSDDASNIALSMIVGLVPAGLSAGLVDTLPATGVVRVPVSLNIYMRLITVVSNGCSRSPLPISTASKLPL